MSLAKTLMKVAIGVAVAKGVSTLAKRASAGGTSGSSGSSSGGLGDLMGDLLGTSGKASTTRTTTRTSSSGGGGLLDEIMGTGQTTTRSSRSTAPKGGLEGVLEQMTGARTGRGGQNSGGSGGIGDLLGSILGGGTAAATRTSGGSLHLDPVEREQEISAALMLKAIIQAVKCDGDLDESEKRKLMEALGDATQDEVQAVNAELSSPVDVDALVRMVPNGLEAEVYVASLSAINLDSQAEAQYLHQLAQALELTPQEVNALHDRAGAPHIYN